MYRCNFAEHSITQTTRDQNLGSLSPSHNLQSSSSKESISFSCHITSRPNKYNHEVQPRYAATILYQLYGKPLPRSTRLWAGSRPSPNCFGLLSRIVSVFSRRICLLLTFILLFRCCCLCSYQVPFRSLVRAHGGCQCWENGRIEGVVGRKRWRGQPNKCSSATWPLW